MEKLKKRLTIHIFQTQQQQTRQIRKKSSNYLFHRYRENRSNLLFLGVHSGTRFFSATTGHGPPGKRYGYSDFLLIGQPGNNPQ